MENSHKIWLGVIFLVVLGLRLWLAFLSPELNYDAYSVTRQVDHISATGTPLFHDDLSYGGRLHVFSPIFDYILAFFNLFMPIIAVLKIIPNIFASLIIFSVYYLSEYMTKNKRVSLISAGFAGLVPVFFLNTINNASVYSLAIPLFFTTIYYFLRTNHDPKYLNKLLILMVFFTLVHPSSIILVVSFLIYVLLIKVQNFRESAREPEVVLFFLFLVLWINMMIFKKALAIHGQAIIWQNIPGVIIQNSYSHITFLQSIIGIGVIPLIFGLISIYISLFVSKRKTTTLMMSVCLTFFILLFFRFIEIEIGLAFLGVALAVLMGPSLNKLYELSKYSRIKNSSHWLTLVTLIVLVVTFIPVISVAKIVASDTPSQKDIDMFLWLKNNTNSDAVILALPEEGSALSYYSGRKNVIDSDYLLIRNIDSRYEDTTSIYEDQFLTTVLEKTNYYSINYIVLSENNFKKTGLSSLAFEGNCVSRVYPVETSLYPPIVYRINCFLSQEVDG